MNEVAILEIQFQNAAHSPPVTAAYNRIIAICLSSNGPTNE